MFDVPLIQFCRELLLELVYVGLDPRSVRVILWWIDSVLMAKRCKAAEVAVFLRQLESLVGELIPACGRMLVWAILVNDVNDSRRASRISGRDCSNVFSRSMRSRSDAESAAAAGLHSLSAICCCHA